MYICLVAKSWGILRTYVGIHCLFSTPLFCINRYYAVDFRMDTFAVSIVRSSLLHREDTQWGLSRLAVEGTNLNTLRNECFVVVCQYVHTIHMWLVHRCSGVFYYMLKDVQFRHLSVLDGSFPKFISMCIWRYPWIETEIICVREIKKLGLQMR